MAHYKHEKLFCLQNCGLVISWKRLAVVSLASLSLAVSGCSTFVDLPKLEVDPVEHSKLPQLYAAFANNEDVRTTKVEKQRNNEERLQQALTALTFGALVGGGTAAVYGAHRDTVLGFGLVGAGAFGTNTTFLPEQRGQNLTAGNDALHCVSQAGLDVLAAEEHLTEEGKRIAKMREDISDCTDPDEYPAEVEAIGLALVAEQNLEAFWALDGTFAAQLQSASAGVIKELNAKLQETAPTPQSALQAAQGVTQFATGFANRLVPAEEPTLSDENVAAARELQIGRRERCESKRLGGSVASELKLRAESLKADLKSKTNRMLTVSATCPFTGIGLTEMGVQPTEIALAKDISATLTVTGAYGTPTIQWKNAVPPANQIQAHFLPPNRFRIEGKSEFPEGQQFEAEIVDSRPVPTPILVTINRQQSGSN